MTNSHLKMSIDLFAIRHKPTGGWIPDRHGRGGSHDEPRVTGRPRLFRSVKAATAFLGMWALGEHMRIPGGQNWQGDWDGDDIKIKPVASRKKEEMEIVCFRAVEQ